MKKIAALTLLSALMLASCNQNPPVTTTSTEAQPTATQTVTASTSADTELNGTLLNFDPTAADFDPSQVVYDPRGLSSAFQSLSLDDRPEVATDPAPDFVPDTSDGVTMTAQALNAWPVLKSGSSGQDVKALQYLLRARGKSVSVDGAFGPGTQSAVKAFQASKNLASDGVVGPQTWQALLVTVQQGSTGEAVKAVQMYVGATVDGVFGAGTASAVKAFQSRNHLSADGVVGPQTWQALIAGVSTNPTPQPPTTGGKGIVATNPIPLSNLSGLERSMAQVYNARGAYLESIRNKYNIPPSVMAAVMLVESGSAAYRTNWASLEGRNMTIRFENHIFYSYWGKSHTSTFNAHYQFNSTSRWKGHLFRVNTSDAWRYVHTGNQSSEWQAFDLASKLSSTNTAANAISMGMGQIMGFNYQACNYASPEAMYRGLQTGAKAQLDGIVNFMLSRSGMLAALRTADFRTVARLYNGSGQIDAYASLIRERHDAYLNVMKKYPR